MLTYVHLDVFTDQLFSGNQLAVCLDPPHDLPQAVMQAIAREMAFSETTFVFPPDVPGTDFRVRIFTPASELPMAGHPTIGTAFALARAGRFARGQASTVFGEGVGPIPLDLEWAGANLTFAWMTQGTPVFGPSLERLDTLASAVGLEPADLDRAAPDARMLARAFADQGWPQRHLYLFTLERGSDDADVYTRMFAPEIGIVEDPATGSASGPLGGYLIQRELPVARQRPIRNLQGVRMGRPSWIHITPVVDRTTVTAVRVGGTAVVVGTGTIDGV